MSKIFDAYKKKIGQSPDLPLELGKAGTVSLYSSPEGKQREDFSKLANRLLGLRREGRGVVLGFASSASGEGASFVSYNTALYLATAYHQRVAWVDANFLSPQKKLLNHDRHTLNSLLLDPRSVEDMVVSDNPVLIAAGGNIQETRRHLANGNYKRLLEHLGHRFDFVILDLPPILESTDTAMMAAEAHGFLLIIEQKYLKVEVIDHGIQGLRDKGVILLGSVINRRTYDIPKVIYDRL